MNTRVAIQSFLQNRQAKNLKPRTIQWYEAELRKFAQSYPELPTEPEPIEEFLTRLPGEPETRHAYFRTLKALYRFLKKRHGLPNPIELVDPPRCPKKIMPTLEPGELMRLLNLADNPRDRALLTLATDTAARASEITSLRKRDIGVDSIRVRGKTGERDIPISEKTRTMLLALVTSGRADEPVFTGQHGPMTRSGIYRVVRIHMQKAGIKGPKLGPHRMRHTFGKCYLVNGGDTRSLQEIMGHANISTTERYASLNLTDIVAKHHRFTPLIAAHAAAQESLFDAGVVIREAEEILAKQKARETPTERKASPGGERGREAPAKKEAAYSSATVGETLPIPGLDKV